MGVDYNAYLGPYLKVPVTPQYVRADRCGHDVEASVKFCPTCGLAQAKRFVQSRRYSDVEIVFEQLEEAGDLTQAGRDYGPEHFACLVPNRTKLFGRTLHFETRTDFNLQRVSPAMVQTEMCDFVDEFDAQLGTVMKLEPDAHIEWGMILWAS